MTTISDNTQWKQLLSDPSPVQSGWFSKAPVQSHPGKDLEDAITKLGQVALNREKDPKEEKAYLAAVDAVYTQFKKRVSVFTLTSGVSKGELLKQMVTDKKLPISTIDFFMQKVCEEELQAFQLPTECSSHLGIGLGQIKEIDSAKKKIEQLAQLYSNPSKMREKLKQQMAQVLTPKLTAQITKLENLREPFVKELKDAFGKDIDAKLDGFKTTLVGLEKRYSAPAKKEIEERLGQFRENLQTTQAEIQTQLQQLKPQLLRNLPGFLAADATKQSQLLGSVSCPTDLQGKLDAYRISVVEIAAKEKELADFLTEKKSRIMQWETESKRWRTFKENPPERERYIAEQIDFVKQQYIELLNSLKESQTAPGFVSSLCGSALHSAKHMAKEAAYVMTIGLGVCAVYAGLFYAGQYLVGSFVGNSGVSSAVNSVEPVLSTALTVAGQIVGNNQNVVSRVVSVVKSVYCFCITKA